MLIKKFAIMKKEIDEDPHRNPAQKVADHAKHQGKQLAH